MTMMVGVRGRRRRERIIGEARIFFDGLNQSKEEEDRLGARVRDMEYVRRR